MRLKKTVFSKSAGVRLCLFLSAILLSFSVSSPSIAQAVTSPCDPQYMDALEARAWMEVQREVAQNKNFIFKPDSVLEYTCFDRFLNEAASNFAPDRQFSETARWSGYPTGFGPTTTDKALSLIVLAPMQSYLDDNFNQAVGLKMGKYLNNRRGPEYTYQSSVNGGLAYHCGQMAAVWEMARCMPFNEVAENAFDGFYDFGYYENHDPRNESKPWAMACGAADPRFTIARATAFNGDETLFDVGTEFLAADGDSIAYKEDDIVTHLDMILPGSCTGKVPTGIMVQRSDLNGGTPYPEIVCTNPGCSATPATPPAVGSCN